MISVRLDPVKEPVRLVFQPVSGKLTADSPIHAIYGIAPGIVASLLDEIMALRGVAPNGWETEPGDALDGGDVHQFRSSKTSISQRTINDTAEIVDGLRKK